MGWGKGRWGRGRGEVKGGVEGRKVVKHHTHVLPIHGKGKVW